VLGELGCSRESLDGVDLACLVSLQIFGLCLLSIGVWALNEKNVFSNMTSKIFLQDPAFFGIIFGSLAFIIGEWSWFFFCGYRRSISCRFHGMHRIVEGKHIPAVAGKTITITMTMHHHHDPKKINLFSTRGSS
jgi:hypothetical protein